jgi:hypothetical protein
MANHIIKDCQNTRLTPKALTLQNRRTDKYLEEVSVGPTWNIGKDKDR